MGWDLWRGRKRCVGVGGERREGLGGDHEVVGDGTRTCSLSRIPYQTRPYWSALREWPLHPGGSVGEEFFTSARVSTRA